MREKYIFAHLGGTCRKTHHNSEFELFQIFSKQSGQRTLNFKIKDLSSKKELQIIYICT